MQDVTITFISGRQQGQSMEFEVGQVTVGRQPEAGGLELKSADADVSRRHAELVEHGGGVELRNLSPNGTLVDGNLVLDSVVLEPGAEIAIGANHTFVLDWARFGRDKQPESADVTPEKAPGPLASPLVRSVLVVYLLGMVALAVWLGGSDETGMSADEWPRLQEAYQAYETEGLTDELRAQRLARVEDLLQEVMALQTRGLNKQVAPICREIMDLDNDVHSPLFQYGAKCLAKAK